jgi:transposase
VSRRQSHQRRRWGQTEEEREQAAERARLEAVRALEAFVASADEHTRALIEQFGASAVRAQRAENEAADAKERQQAERQQARRTMADALALARANPSPSFRIVLYTERRRDFFGIPDVPAEVRRKRTLADLEKLGIAVEYVNPNG